jgi:hypothetical protein
VSSTSGTFSQAGGLAGESSGTIEDSSSTATVTGNAQNVGGLVGASFGDAGLINNSTASGDVNGAEDVGGLAGFNDAVVRASSSSSAVEGPLSVGGLVGDNRGLISSTTASGAVTANTTGSFSVAGGLVGFDNGTIERSVSTASVTGNKTRVGGLVAEQDSGSSINDSYAKGDVSGNTQVGGLVAFSRGTIEDSYASGSVSGASTVGGLMAFNDGATVTASYWDTAATGQSTSDGGTGLTTSEMQGSAAETNMDGFDFTNTWTTASGEYPGLQR